MPGCRTDGDRAGRKKYVIMLRALGVNWDEIRMKSRQRHLRILTSGKAKAILWHLTVHTGELRQYVYREEFLFASLGSASNFGFHVRLPACILFLDALNTDER